MLFPVSRLVRKPFQQAVGAVVANGSAVCDREVLHAPVATLHVTGWDGETSKRPEDEGTRFQTSLRQLSASPWSLQAVRTGVVDAASQGATVEEWWEELYSLPDDCRAVVKGLLARHPSLIWSTSPKKLSQVCQLLLETLHEKANIHANRWFYSDRLVLHLVERCCPETLRQRLSSLHNSVWSSIDDADVLLAMRRSCAMDLLDLDAHSLAAKAQKLHTLVRAFRPSTVLRAAPELQDVEPEEVHRCVQEAGSVLVVADPAVANQVFLRALPDGRAELVRCRPSPALSLSSYRYAGRARSPAYAAVYLMDDVVSTRQEVEVLQTVAPGMRAILYVGDGFKVEMRFEAPAADAGAA